MPDEPDVFEKEEVMNNLFIQINEAVSRKTEDIDEEILREVVTLNEVTIYRSQDAKWYFGITENGTIPCVETQNNYENITLFCDDERKWSYYIQFLLRTAFECRFCYKGIISLHAACVENGEFSIAFTGKSGMGKSTRAQAWITGLGFAWLSGDRPAVRIEREGSVACGVPWDGKEQIFRDVERPLKAIMEVRRSSANYIRKLSNDQARQVLMQQCFVPMWDTEAALMAIANVRALLKKTPVYRVFCGPTENDAHAIYDILINHPEQIREEVKEMKIKDGFVLRNMMDEYIVMPTGDNIAKFDGVVVLNEVSAFVFKQLKNPVGWEDLLSAVLAEFDVDEETAKEDLNEVLEEFRKLKLIEG